jgi:hypothetical protein
MSINIYMNKNKCNICNKIFTRDWNLKRHIQDVYRLNDYDKKDNIKQEFEENYYLPNSNSSYKENHINYYNNQNPFYYNNFPNTFDNPASYNNEFYQYSNFKLSSLEKDKRLSNDEKIRIQKVLKNLQNLLEKIIPKSNILWIIENLWCKCIREQSEEPLKKFLILYKMAYLWP